MLDDLKYIHQRDAQDALGIAEKQPAQLEYQFDLPKLDGEFSNIVYAGMGGSALAALLMKTWPGCKLPFELTRDYDIPSYVSDKTLFIASSYSGNTEETLSALAEAEAKGAQIVVIAGGGKLVEIAQQKNHPCLVLPKVGQPRYAVLYSLKALVSVLVAAGAAEKTVLEEATKASVFLKESLGAWLPTVPSNENTAKKLALELAGKSVVIYAGPLLAPAAYKWKISFNENAKNIAWWNQLSELNHNEISGWISHPVQKPYGVAELQSSLDHPRIARRYEVMNQMLSGKMPAPEIVSAKGDTKLEQLLWSVMFGDFVSIYLALVNNVDPSPVDLQENFKKNLG